MPPSPPGTNAPRTAPLDGPRARHGQEAQGGLEFRNAREDDLDRLVDIHSSAFPDPRSAEPRRRNFVANPLGPLDTLRVATAGDVIVAHAFLFAFDVWFGGRAVRVGAIASVGVAPEARGRGIGAALVADLHDQALARGAAITLLYPFRQGFYARHGYAAVTPSRRIVTHPGAFPAAWARGGALTLRAANGLDRDAIIEAYERAAARSTGWLSRPSALWTRHLANERRVWIAAIDPAHGEKGGKLVGYVSWSLVQSEAHAITHLVVHELVAEDDPVRRALLGAIAAQRDQVHAVEIEVDADDPLDRALIDADRALFGTAKVEHVLGVLAGGPMVRIADLRRAIEARGYRHDGELDVTVDGEAELHVSIHGGRATVGEACGGAGIAVDGASFAAILYGALAPRDAARLGLLRATDDAALAHADACLALAPYLAIDSF